MKVIRLSLLSWALLFAQTKVQANLVPNAPITKLLGSSTVSPQNELPIEPSTLSQTQEKKSLKKKPFSRQKNKGKIGRWEGIFFIASISAASLAVIFQIGMALELANSFIYTAYGLMLGTVSILWMVAIACAAVALIGLILRWMKKHTAAHSIQ